MKNKTWKILALLSSMGAALSLYFLYVNMIGTGPICPTGGCEDVLASKYSSFLGFPVAGWGLLYYVGFFVLSILKEKKKLPVLTKRIGAYLASGVIFTIYLRYLELFKIGSLCFWCWLSVLIIAVMTYLYIVELKRKS